MKVLFALTAIVIAAAAGFAAPCLASEGAPPHSRIDFYPTGARVLFEVPATGKVGFVLPGAFDFSTLRPLPAPGQKVVSFEAVEVSRPGWVPDYLEGLHGTIKEKEKAVAHLAARESAIRQSFSLLGGPLPRDLKGADMAEYVEAARIVREKLETDLISIASDLEEERKELGALRNDYENLLPENASSSVSVTAEVEGGQTLLVEAWTAHAEWNPFYRMNLDSDSGLISASLMARARQMTGMTFSGDLYFHTVTPSMSVSPPELRPQVADFAPKTRTTASMGAPGADTFAMPMMAPSPRAEKAAPQIARTMTDMSARAKGSIPGDNRLGEFLLGEFELKSEVSVVAVPILSGEAWITSETKKIPVTILPGPAELSVDGALSAKTSLGEQGAGGDLFLAFGKIPLIKAVREKIVPKEGSAWWSGKGRKEDGYTIEVTNGLAKEVTVLLKDRIPVSAQEKITVETEKTEPRPTERDEKEILTWKLTLAPGEKKKVEVVYRMQYPSDETVIFR